MKPAACIFLIFISSCVSNELPQANNCDVANPIEDLPWLKAEIADRNDSEMERKYWYITQASYKVETVFIVKNCCPMCSMLPPPVYSCDGELLFRATDEEYNRISHERIIWKSAEYECTF